jgi:Sulfotransferase family
VNTAAKKSKAMVRRALRVVDDRADLRKERNTLRAERDLLRLVVRDDAARLESMVTELHRLRELAFGAEQRDTPAYDYLFVLTYGRTGSTLLQGILDRTPGYCIRGENGGVVYELFRYHRTAIRHRDRLARKEPLPPQHPWWGIDGFPEDVALRDYRHLVLDTVLRPTVGSRVVGYKEIEWGYDDLDDYLDFMRRVFPGARYVVNTRDLADVAKSKWWANRPDAREHLEKLDGRVRAAGERLGDAAYHVHYDDYKDDPAALRGMFQWLGAPFDRNRIAAVMSQPHSY